MQHPNSPKSAMIAASVNAALVSEPASCFTNQPLRGASPLSSTGWFQTEGLQLEQLSQRCPLSDGSITTGVFRPPQILAAGRGTRRALRASTKVCADNRSVPSVLPCLRSQKSNGSPARARQPGFCIFCRYRRPLRIINRQSLASPHQ
jgi:hypothetical protein